MHEASLAKYLDTPLDIFNKLKNETLLFFDTETTGLNPHENQLTEIAAQVVQGPEFKVIGEFDRKIALNEDTKLKIEKEKSLPIDPKKKTIEQVLEMNRYNDNSMRADNEQTVLSDFKDFCERHNAIIVGQNAKFDMGFVNTRGKMKIANKGVYDTMLFARYFLIPAIKALSEKDIPKELIREQYLVNDKGEIKSTLENLLKAFSQRISGWHRALDDVKSTIKAFQNIMAYFNEYTDVHREDTFKKEIGKAMSRQRELTLSPGKKKRLRKIRGKEPYYKYAKEFVMNITENLDKVAYMLESKGFFKEAEEIDVISNTIDKYALENEIDPTEKNEPGPETTVGINDFVKRQYNAPTGNQPTWTIVPEPKMEEIRKKVEQALRSGKHKPGYAPEFTKTVIIKDPSILSPIVKITPENKHYLYDQMSKRRDGEEEFKGTYFDSRYVKRVPSDHITVGLYTRHQLKKENGDPTGADYDIITVNAEPEAIDSPMTPSTMKRNKDILSGGSGHEHSKDEMSAGESYWMNHAMVR